MTPKSLPKRSQNGPKIGVGSEVGSEADFGPILDRFGSDLGPFWGRFRSDFRLFFDRFLVEAPQLALYAYMLVCIYAIMQKCMHTLMKCTTSLGHGESSMQKGGAPVTRPVGVLDPAPPARGCSCDGHHGNSCHSCQFLQICNPPAPRGESNPPPPHRFFLLLSLKMPPRWLKKSTSWKHFC